MVYVVDRILSLYYNQPKCVYTERINCFEKLAELQKNIRFINDENMKQPSQSAEKSIADFNTKYIKEYERCSEIMKPSDK